jgi:hypothetical protein
MSYEPNPLLGGQEFLADLKALAESAKKTADTIPATLFPESAKFWEAAYAALSKASRELSREWKS